MTTMNTPPMKKVNHDFEQNVAPTTTWNNLPAELKARIFEHLDFVDSRRMMMVARQEYQIVEKVCKCKIGLEASDMAMSSSQMANSYVIKVNDFRKDNEKELFILMFTKQGPDTIVKKFNKLADIYISRVPRICPTAFFEETDAKTMMISVFKKLLCKHNIQALEIYMRNWPKETGQLERFNSKLLYFTVSESDHWMQFFEKAQSLPVLVFKRHHNETKVLFDFSKVFDHPKFKTAGTALFLFAYFKMTDEQFLAFEGQNLLIFTNTVTGKAINQRLQYWMKAAKGELYFQTTFVIVGAENCNISDILEGLNQVDPEKEPWVRGLEKKYSAPIKITKHYYVKKNDFNMKDYCGHLSVGTYGSTKLISFATRSLKRMEGKHYDLISLLGHFNCLSQAKKAFEIALQ